MWDGVKGMLAVYAAPAAIPNCMDNTFIQHLGLESDVVDQLGNQTSQAVINNYTEVVIVGLNQLIPMLMPKTTDNTVMPGPLDWCIAKIKIFHVLHSMGLLDHTSFLLVPFMSRSVYMHMVKQLKWVLGVLMKVSMLSQVEHMHIPHFRGVLKCGICMDLRYALLIESNNILMTCFLCSISQYARWFKSMVDMVLTIGKYWMPGSPTTTMISMLQCHRDITEQQHCIAVLCVSHLKHLHSFNATKHFPPTDHIHFMEPLHRLHEPINTTCQDMGQTPDQNSRNLEFAWTWDLASAYVLCPCCSSGPRGWKRSGQSVRARG